MKLAFPLTLALLLAGCGDDPQARLDRARQANVAHHYDAAQIDLTALLDTQPDNHAAIVLLARNALAMGNGAAASAALARLPDSARPQDYALLAGEAALQRERPREALAAIKGQSSAEAARIRALALLGQDDMAGSARAFESGLATSGSNVRLLADYAIFKLHTGNTGAARVLVTKALRADPDSLEARLADAQIAVAEGNLGHALTAYDQVATVWPGNLAAAAGKAGVLGDLGRTKEAEAVLASASSAGGSHGALAYLQARAAAGRGDWNTARSVLQANEIRLAGSNEAAVLYAQALSALGQHEQARARLVPLLRRNPDNALVRRELAKAELAGGDAKAAEATLRALAAQPTADPDDLHLLARAAKAAGDPEAARLAARAQFPSPQSLSAALASADTAMKARNWGNAIALYERIIAVTDGKNALVLNNLAFAQGQVGNNDKALGYALRALKQAPNNASVMDTAGWLLLATGGDRNRALVLLREAARKAPGNGTIRAHLAQAAARS